MSDFEIAENNLRLDFFNSIGKLLTYNEDFTFDMELNDAEKKAVEHMLSVFGRIYYGPVCTVMINAHYQNLLAQVLKPELKVADDHEACPCVRSEKHRDFHRCKHGYFS